MDELDVRTIIHLPPADVYEFLVDFRRYVRYSKYLHDVTVVGDESDGVVGTEYDMRFGWWKVGYDVRSQVTEVDPPNRIAFELTRGIRANGEWRVGRDGDVARVQFLVRYDPDTVASDAVNLPPLVSLDWVIERVEPMVEREARRVVERVVADLEGEQRDVDLDVTWRDG